MKLFLTFVAVLTLAVLAAVGGNLLGLWSLPVTLTSENGLGVDPAVGRGLKPISRAHDGAERRIAAIRFGNRPVSEFVDDELLISTADEKAVKDLAARYGGKVLHRIDRPAATGRPPMWNIRVNLDKAPDFQFGDELRGMRVSTPRTARLLAIAAAEHEENGLRLGLNFIARPLSLTTGVTQESNGVDAGTFDYMRPGGPLDVDVINAWRALAIAGKLGNKVKIGVIDQGYGLGNGFQEADWPKDSILLAGNNASTDANVWHGNSVVDVLAGVPDDGQGTAGPAGPIATIIAAGKGDTICDMDAALWEIAGYGVQIITISQAATLDSGLESTWGWLQGADDLEDDMEFLATTGDKLIFAGAGNSNTDVDAVDSDGDEATWWMPCENHGVICVNGWAPPTMNSYGKLPDPQSNYGNNKGDTVDIAGPMWAFVGNNPAAPAASPAPQPNGPPHGLTLRGGTSYSTPFVAGVAALVRAANPDLTAAQVWQLMVDASVKASPTIRRVRAYGAVRAALKMDGVNAKPFVRIIAPAPGSTVPQAGKVTFKLDAFDPEDGPNCCFAAWTSSLDGFLGKNFEQTFAFGGRPLGQRTVSVNVADNNGGIGTAEATFTLANAKPKVTIVKKPDGVVVAGTSHVFGAQVLDDANLAGVPDATACKTVGWGVANKLAGQGCDQLLTFPAPGQVVVTAAYTDAYGAMGFATTVVTVVAPEPGAPIVSLINPKPGEVFTATEFIPAVYQITDPAVGNGMPPDYELTWTLTLLASNETRTPPIPKGGLGFKIIDVFPEVGPSTGFNTFRLSLTVKNPKTGKSSNTASVLIKISPEIH